MDLINMWNSVMMPIPDTFLHLVATGSAFLAGLFIIASILSEERAHCLRLAGLTLIFCLALFADSPWTYGVSIFLTATAITELAFIERFAAIVFRHKEYFSPARSPGPPAIDESAMVAKERPDDAGNEAAKQGQDSANTAASSVNNEHVLGGPSASTFPTSQESAHEVSSHLGPKDIVIRQLGGLARVYEILSIDKLSRVTGRTFEHNVLIKLKSGVVNLDAFSEGKTGLPDILVEVKTVSRRDEEALLLAAHNTLIAMNTYREETKKSIVGVFIVVLQAHNELSVETRQRLQNLALSQKFTVQLQIYQFSEFFVK